MNEQQLSEAIVVIADYAKKQGWTPIGFRSFSVGPWDITVNGTRERRDDLEPWHVRAVHRDIIAILVFNAFGGSAGGWKDTEAQFIADMRAAL